MPDIVCTLTDDDARERLAEYARLFAAAYAGRERTATGMRWSLRAGPGIAAWALDLAVRERACCAFLTIAVTEEGDRVLWELSADPVAQPVVDLFYDLPVGTPGDCRANRVSERGDRRSGHCESDDRSSPCPFPLIPPSSAGSPRG
jgi:hypothetical protein